MLVQPPAWAPAWAPAQAQAPAWRPVLGLAQVPEQVPGQVPEQEQLVVRLEQEFQLEPQLQLALVLKPEPLLGLEPMRVALAEWSTEPALEQQLGCWRPQPSHTGGRGLVARALRSEWERLELAVILKPKRELAARPGRLLELQVLAFFF